MLLPGWTASRGARLEVSIAKELGVVFMFADGAEREPAAQPKGESVIFVDTSELRNLKVSGFESFSALLHKEQACMLSPQRVAFYAEQPVPVAVVLSDVDDLAQIIRRVDGTHSLGAGVLAEAIHQELTRLNTK